MRTTRENLAPVEIAEVRKDQVDAEVLVAREREPGVDHERRAVGLEHGHVLADLAEAAEGDDPKCRVAHVVEKHTARAGRPTAWLTGFRRGLPRSRELWRYPFKGRETQAPSRDNVLMRRCSTYLGVLAALIAAFLVGPAGASNGNHYSFGQNVDPTLANAINSSQTAGNATSSSTYHVMVFGNAPDLTHADSAAGVSQRDNLTTVGAQSVTVTAAQAAQLSSQPGVQFVTADTPMAPDAAPGPPRTARPARPVEREHRHAGLVLEPPDALPAD